MATSIWYYYLGAEHMTYYGKKKVVSEEVITDKA
jgi:hypothetical protein